MKMNIDYIKKIQSKRYERLVNYRIEKRDDSELTTISVKDGIVLPLKKNVNRYTLGAAGVVDSNTGKYIPESAVISRGASIYTPAECGDDINLEYYINGPYKYDESQVEYCDERVVYLGYLINHWGHFLIDCTSRLWYIFENKDNLRYVFFPEAENDKEIPKPICDFLRYLGIYDNIIFVRKPTKFAEVVIPKLGYVTNYYYTDKHLKVFDVVARNALVDTESYYVPENIYFTRVSHRKARRTEFGENAIVEIFENNGYSIVSPEKLDLKTQIMYYNRAKNIVCVAGTIAHNMLLVANNRNITIINKTYIINMMQMDINYMRNLDVTYVDAYYAYRPTPLGCGPFFLSVTPEFLEYADLKKIIVSPKYEIKSSSIVSRQYLIKIRNLKMSQDDLLKTSDYSFVHYFEPGLTDDFVNSFEDNEKKTDIVILVYLRIKQYVENIYFGLRNRFFKAFNQR